jgi:protein involved in polysaccharide export with SLBB domain
VLGHFTILTALSSAGGFKKKDQIKSMRIRYITAANIKRARVGRGAAPRARAARGPGRHILVQAYLVLFSFIFLLYFRHNFTENGPQDLKMV